MAEKLQTVPVPAPAPETHHHLPSVLHHIAQIAHQAIYPVIPAGNTTNLPHLQSARHQTHPAFDLEEHEHSFEIYGNLPGANRNDILIHATSDFTLEISGTLTQHGIDEPLSSNTLASNDDATDPFVKISRTSSVASKGSEPVTSAEASANINSIDGGPCTKTHHSDNAIQTPVEVGAPLHASHSKSEKVFKVRHLLKERRVGDFHKAFHFIIPIIQEEVIAKYNAGILHITLPKGKELERRQVDIQWGGLGMF